MDTDVLWSRLGVSHDRLRKAHKALLALAAGAHGEKDVNPRWVVAVALQGLGVGVPATTLAFVRLENTPGGAK